jgi:two-component system chemotaxis sensor kinase CheA
MDPAQYMPMFLAEGREHLQQLNLAVVRLEENPHDRDTVDEIFRIAHSIKGMSATMGFDAIAALTHEMEDVFELLRRREEAIAHDAVDVVLLCLDALACALEEIEASGADTLDPGPLTEKLRQLVRARTEDQQLERQGGRVAPDLTAAIKTGLRVLLVVARLRDDVMMPSVRAHMVLAAVSEHGELIGSAPAPDFVEQFEGTEIEAWIACEHEEHAVAETVRAISDVAEVSVTEIAAATAPEPAAHEGAVHEPAPAPAAPRPASGTRTVRVDAERLDALMHAMGELVIHRTALQELADHAEIPGLQHALQDLTRSSQALQSMVMQVRMIPVDVVFLRLPRLVRDLTAKLGKSARLELVGSDTELDRTVVDALGDPLVHLVRNALDHGMETSEQRVAAGKDPSGIVTVSARHAGSSVIIEVSDDGRGIDLAAVARHAVMAGLLDPQAAQEIDMRTAIELLFTPGFSTTEAANDISGRGVGMDAVRDRIRELGGEVVVDSVIGEGTTAQIRLPLTLAIVSGLLVEVGDAPYAIPLDRIERTLLLEDSAVRRLAGETLLMLDDEVLPLLHGGDVFGRAGADAVFVVIVRTLDRHVALTVGDLIGQRELVTRALPATVTGGEPVSGGAALPDGRIALIVDCDAFGRHGRDLTSSDRRAARIAA